MSQLQNKIESLEADLESLEKRIVQLENTPGDPDQDYSAIDFLIVEYESMSRELAQLKDLL